MTNTKILKFNIKDIKKLFLSKNKNQDPILSFYEYIILEEGKEVEFLSNPRGLDVTKVRINHTDYRKNVYEGLLTSFAKKYGKYLNERGLAMSIAMHDLQFGPSTYEDIPSGEIHLLDGWLSAPDEEL